MIFLKLNQFYLIKSNIINLLNMKNRLRTIINISKYFKLKQFNSVDDFYGYKKFY